MNNLFLRLKNLPIYLCPAFIFTAGTLLVINIITLIPSKRFEALYEGVNTAIPALFAFAACALIVFYVCKNSKKAIAAGYSILLFDVVLFSLCNVHISFVFSIILSLLFSFVFERFNLVSAFTFCAVISLVLALLSGLGYDYLFSLLKALCSKLKGRGALFGLVNNAYSLFFSYNLSKLFYFKDYSGTALSESGIITGVIDIFKAQKVAGINVSKYLTGKYFVNVFVSLGLLLLLIRKLEEEKQAAFFISFLVAVIFGDVRLFALFILVYNPLMYIGYLFLVFVSYLSAFLLDIRIVFLKSGSLFELFKYMDKPVYFFLAGLVITVLTYFLESIIISKFDFQSSRFIPFEVRRIIKALGGERNIEKVRGDCVILKNSNLVDILSLDCEVHGNSVSLYSDEISLLKQYF